MKTLLVIDDDESIRLLLRDKLCPLGYNVVTASDGDEGLISFSEQEIDLILLDMDLPKVDGMEVLRSLKEDGHDIPVIIFTVDTGLVKNKENFENISVVCKSSEMQTLVDEVVKVCNDKC